MRRRPLLPRCTGDGLGATCVASDCPGGCLNDPTAFNPPPTPTTQENPHAQ